MSGGWSGRWPTAALVLAAFALLTRCTFDDSKLEALECEDDDDCAGGARCVDGGCTREPPQTFAEMCARPAVVFCDDFEDGISAGWFGQEGLVDVEPGAASPGEGEQVLVLATHEAAPSAKLLLVFDTLPSDGWVRFDVLYGEDFVDQAGALGPSFGGTVEPPYGMLGNCCEQPTGDDYFMARINPSVPAFLLEGFFHNMSGAGPGQYFGNSLVPDGVSPPEVELGRWHCVEVGIHLNGPDLADGSAQYRIDGRVVGPRGDIEWRTVGDLGVNTLSLDAYNPFEEGGPPASSPNLARFDNVVVSTAPVGCLAR